jgi:integrase
MATRAIHRLTSLAVKRATARGLYPDGQGLYLQVARNGSRSWVLRYRLGGRRRYLGLGATHCTSLAQARELAAAAHRQLLAGIDPVEARRVSAAALRLSDAKAMSFAQAAEQYFASHKAGWKPSHANQWQASLATHAYPVIGSLPVQAIDTALVLKVLEPIWATLTETAGRIRARIESVLDWAAARGYRTGDNPARWRGHLDHLLPERTKVRKVEHLAALPYADLPDFLAELRQRPGIPARAMEFAILTASRPGEALGAQWAEVDLEARTWTVPAERMKAGREHRVPLSDAAMALLEALPGPRSGPVFPGARPGLSIGKNAMIVLLHRMGQHVTVHGFRSTFRDWAAEMTEFPAEVCEAALAHVVGDKTEAAYRRGDLLERRRMLMEAWASYAGGEHLGASVIPLRA